MGLGKTLANRTVARNYQKGAGGFFDGIDALSMTGSYTTYALKTDLFFTMTDALGIKR